MVLLETTAKVRKKALYTCSQKLKVNYDNLSILYFKNYSVANVKKSSTNQRFLEPFKTNNCIP